MRVVSLLILLSIIGGLAFVFIHEPTRKKIFGAAEEAAFQAEGYALASTPREAMDFFEKAIKSRNYKAAARYVTEDYAKVLQKGHDAARSVGNRLDRINNIMKDKDLRSPMSLDLILNMDPFPDTFKLKHVKDVKKEESAEGQFEFEEKVKGVTGREIAETEKSRLDQNMYFNLPLRPMEFFKSVAVTLDKKTKSWKINFVPNTSACDYFVEHHKRYLDPYDRFIDELTRGQIHRDAAATELLEVMVRAK